MFEDISVFGIGPGGLSAGAEPANTPPPPYLSHVVLSRVAMVAEPVEEGLVDAPRGLPGFAVGRQVLPAVPQDGVGEGGGGSWGGGNNKDSQVSSDLFNRGCGGLIPAHLSRPRGAPS